MPLPEEESAKAPEADPVSDALRKWWAANETALAVMQSGVVYTIVKPDNSIAHVIKQGRDVKVLKAQIIKV